MNNQEVEQNDNGYVQGKKKVVSDMEVKAFTLPDTNLFLKHCRKPPPSLSFLHIFCFKYRLYVCIIIFNTTKKHTMDTANKTVITVENTVNAPVEKVWQFWTSPEHITKWNSASPDWHTPWAENDLRTGGAFKSRMEARDGSFGFEFGGVYDEVTTHERLRYTMGDGRQVDVQFTADGNSTKVVESFDAENQHSHEMQKSGWQAILDNFKKYTEEN